MEALFVRYLLRGLRRGPRCVFAVLCRAWESLDEWSRVATRKTAVFGAVLRDWWKGAFRSVGPPHLVQWCWVCRQMLSGQKEVTGNLVPVAPICAPYTLPLCSGKGHIHLHGRNGPLEVNAKVLCSFSAVQPSSRDMYELPFIKYSDVNM